MSVCGIVLRSDTNADLSMRSLSVLFQHRLQNENESRMNEAKYNE